MNKLGAKRLLKLADHLRNGKLAHKKFDFGKFNACETDEEPQYCGTLGCAVGECPAIWPKTWVWEGFTVQLVETEVPSRLNNWNSVIRGFKAASRFFNISQLESEALFAPGQPRPWVYRKSKLSRRTSKLRVADSIEKFVAWKQAGCSL